MLKFNKIKLNLLYRLGQLEAELLNENIRDIRFLIINAFDSESIDNISVLKNLTSITILQDTPKINIWGLYNGTLGNCFF